MAVQSTTSTSSIDPALLPYLQTGLERAQSLFLTGEQPRFFEGQTYVSPSQQTLDALAQQEAIARGGSNVLQQAQQVYGAGLGATSAATPMYQNIYSAAQQPMAGSDVYGQAAQGGFGNLATQQLQNIASGSFLGGNPYQQAMMQAATRPLEQQFTQSVLPSISSLYSKTGRLGSGAMERALSQATEAQTRALGDITSNIAGQQFQQERALQQQALGQLAGVSQQDIANRLAGAQGLGALQQSQLGTQLQATSGLAQTQASDLSRQLQAAAAAPSIYAQQFIPSQQLGQIGAAREQIAALPLQEQMQRFQFGQQLPYQQLSGYLSSVYGSPMGSYGTQTQSTSMPSNPFVNTAAGAGLGYLAGQGINAFLNPSQGFSLTSPSGFGLAGGALGGLLGNLF
jgi:hypothetical protein